VIVVGSAVFTIPLVQSTADDAEIDIVAESGPASQLVCLLDDDLLLGIDWNPLRRATDDKLLKL